MNDSKWDSTERCTVNRAHPTHHQEPKMSELMRQAMDTNQWTFDMLRDPGWQPDRDSYQSMRDGLVARLRTVEAERRDAIQAGVVLAEHLGEQLLAAEARVEAAEQDLLRRDVELYILRMNASDETTEACAHFIAAYGMKPALLDGLRVDDFIQAALVSRRAVLAVSGNQPQ